MEAGVGARPDRHRPARRRPARRRTDDRRPARPVRGLVVRRRCTRLPSVCRLAVGRAGRARYGDRRHDPAPLCAPPPSRRCDPSAVRPGRSDPERSDGDSLHQPAARPGRSRRGRSRGCRSCVLEVGDLRPGRCRRRACGHRPTTPARSIRNRVVGACAGRLAVRARAARQRARGSLRPAPARCRATVVRAAPANRGFRRRLHPRRVPTDRRDRRLGAPRRARGVRARPAPRRGVDGGRMAGAAVHLATDRRRSGWRR